MTEGAPTPDKMDDTINELRSRAELLERRLIDLQCQSNMRVIQAEMKAEAIRAGMIDLDGLKLLDLSVVKLDENGGVQGGLEMIECLKKAKPWLFKSVSSSSPLNAPPAQPPRQKRATDMTDAEYIVARAAILKPRY